MKKILLFLLIFSTSFLFLIAQENPSEQQTISEENPFIQEADTIKDIESQKLSLQTTEGKKGLLSFGNTNKFILADDISLFTENAVGALKQKNGTITVYPKEKLLGFGSPYLLAYYLFFVNAENAEVLEKAVATYLNDFENKKLERNKKTIKKYGKADATLYWGTTKSSTPNNGKGKCNLGYKFVDKSPYFTITFYPIYNEYCSINTGADKESIQLTYYFTKAQAKELVSFISKENINSVFEIYEENITGKFTDADNY